MLSICSSALAVVVDGAIRNQDRAATAKALFLMVACYCDCYCDLAEYHVSKGSLCWTPFFVYGPTLIVWTTSCWNDLTAIVTKTHDRTKKGSAFCRVSFGNVRVLHNGYWK